jgi:hypothetical protein
MNQYDFHDNRAQPDTFWGRNCGFILMSAFWIVVIAWHYWPSIHFPQMVAPIATAAPSTQPSTSLIGGLIGLIGPFALAAVVIRVMWSVVQVLTLYVIGIAVVLYSVYYFY